MSNVVKKSLLSRMFTGWLPITGLFFLFPLMLTADRIHWLGGDGNWNDPTKWEYNIVPGVGSPGDEDYYFLYVNITAAGSYMVTLDNMDATISSLTLGVSEGQQALFVDGQTIILIEGRSQSTISDSGYLFLLNGSVTVDSNYSTISEEILTNKGTIRMQDDSAFEIPIINQGLLIASHGINVITESFSNTSAGTLAVEGHSEMDGETILVLGGFTNEGTIELIHGPQDQTVGLSIPKGTLVNAAGATIQSLGESESDTVYLEAQLDNRGTLTTNGLLVMGKDGADIVQLNSGTINVIGGDLVLEQTDTLEPGIFQNTGIVDIDTSRSFTVIGGYVANEETGTIRGEGTLNVLQSNFINYGVINPGSSPGILTIAGNVSLEDSTVVNIEIGGNTVGKEYDQLRITGSVDFGGRLNIDLINNFIPSINDSFEIITYGDRLGVFDEENGLSFFSDELSFKPVYKDHSLVLVTIGSDSNNAPLAVNDTVITNEDVSVTASVLINDSDPNGDVLKISGVTQGDYGTVVINPGDTTVTYTPDNNHNGTDIFRYVVTDGALVDTGIVSVTIIAVNDPPASFTRILPQDGSIQTPDSVVFRWTKSNDVDGDTIHYTLSIRIGVTDTSFSTMDTTLIIDFGNFDLSPDSLDVNWSLTATDGELVTAPANGEGRFILDNTLSLENSSGAIPDKYVLRQNYPNPFNPVTTIRYNLPDRSFVRLVIYDIMGREMRTLVSGIEDPGIKVVVWDARDDFGRPVGAGVYLYRLSAGKPGEVGFSRIRKMVLVK